MKQYFLEKSRIFSIRKLTVGVASVAVGLAFFASGNVAANEVVTEPKTGSRRSSQRTNRCR